MDWLERHLAVFPDPELVFVIGAGQGRDLSALARFSQTRLVLLEPQPRWADFLRQQTVSLPNTEVLQYALDDSSGISTLTVFNFAELSSLRPDPALTSLLPGARQTAQLQVETRSLGDLVESLEIPGGANNWLIVDALGVESAVIDGLADSDLRSRFGHIVMRTHQQAPNSVDPNLSTTAYTLLTFGYRPLGDMDYSDGDWPRMHLQHFDRSPQHKELETKVVALEQRSNEIETEKIDLQEQIAKLGE
ncbi:MAG: FkbM family methyltransferase, partial [Pseudomonadota bacterium]